MNLGDLRLSDFVDANGLHRGQLFEDLNGNNLADTNELNINLLPGNSQATFSLQDVLV